MDPIKVIFKYVGDWPTELTPSSEHNVKIVDVYYSKDGKFIIQEIMYIGPKEEDF